MLCGSIEFYLAELIVSAGPLLTNELHLLLIVLSPAWHRFSLIKLSMILRSSSLSNLV